MVENNETKTNNSRIMKNTVLLYCRLVACMLLAFFSSRELLRVIGVVDYGLINVISSVVTMFSFLSGMMTTASTRYFAYYIGRKDYDSLKRVFNLILLMYLGLAAILLLLSETVGLYLFHHKIMIPLDRFEASAYFFHFTVLTFLTQVLIIPYESLVISYEDMKKFTVASVGQATGKLLIVYLLVVNGFDALVAYGLYSWLIFMVSLAFYVYVCYKNYPESRPCFYWNFEIFKELLSFSGWNFFGAVSGLFSNVLVNILLNNYFGPSVNAARGIATQVSGAVSGFMQNFLTASKPQITKYWANNQKEAMHLLVFNSSKIGYFLMLLMSLPVLMETEFLLRVWLTEVPLHTVAFTRLVIVQILIDTVSYPLMTAAQATGKIALYQSVVGGALWLNLPVSWLCLKYGCPPESTMWTAIVISVLCFLLRIVIVRKICGLSIRRFISLVLQKIVMVTVLSAAFLMMAKNALADTPINSVVVCGSSFIAVLFFSGLCGLDCKEKVYLKTIITNRLERLKK